MFELPVHAGYSDLDSISRSQQHQKGQCCDSNSMKWKTTIPLFSLTGLSTVLLYLCGSDKGI